MLSVVPQEVQHPYHQYSHHYHYYPHQYPQGQFYPHHQHQVSYPPTSVSAPSYYPSYLPSPDMPHREPSSPLSLSLPSISRMGVPSKNPNDASVAQALEIARESPDGAQDPTVSKILDNALARIWGNVEAHPDTYVMSKDEFAVFNFFQHRFSGDQKAVDARKRYWDNLRA